MFQLSTYLVLEYVLANLMTPVVSAILINSTNPFGNIPNKAAEEATTDVLMPASLSQKLQQIK